MYNSLRISSKRGFNLNINVWPIITIRRRAWEKKAKEEHNLYLQEQDLKIVKDELSKMDYYDGKIEPTRSLMMSEAKGEIGRENMDTILSNMRESIAKVDKTIIVSQEIYKQNKTIIRYFSQGANENMITSMSTHIGKFDYMDPCLCGSGKEYFRCHLK